CRSASRSSARSCSRSGWATAPWSTRVTRTGTGWCSNGSQSQVPRIRISTKPRCTAIARAKAESPSLIACLRRGESTVTYRSDVVCNSALNHEGHEDHGEVMQKEKDSWILRVLRALRGSFRIGDQYERPRN